VEQIELPEEEKNLNKKQEETSSKKNTDIPIKQAEEPVKKTADGQTLLDVSKGNITLTSAGATGGVQAVRHL
ncbi:MAG: hypothetical protein KH180_14865, partial [Anaerostipes sp.]|nr:hypothetical protein [Anaerostipes sp.]